MAVIRLAGWFCRGARLYRTTEEGGTASNGTVFGINTIGTGFTNLHSFAAVSKTSPYTNSEGTEPFAGVIISGGMLYGTAQYGGVYGKGTVFALNTNGTGFTNLHSFTGGTDGATPLAGVVLLGPTLYGTAFLGGLYGAGTVFALNSTTLGFTNLHSFNGTADGVYPEAGLLLSGSTCGGAAANGGAAARARCSRLTPTVQVLRTCTISRRLPELIPPTAMEPTRTPDYSCLAATCMGRQSMAATWDLAQFSA